MGISMGDVIAQGIIGAVGGAAQGAQTTALLEQKEEIEKVREQRLSSLRTQEHAANTTSDIAAKQAAEDANASQRADFYKGSVAPATTTKAPYVDTTGGEDTGAAPGATVDVTKPATRGEQAAYRLEKAKQTGRADLIAQAYTEDKDARADSDQQRKQKLEESKLGIEAQHASYYVAAAERMNAEAEAIRNGEKYKKANEKTQLPNVKINRDDASGMTYNVDANSGAIGVLVPGEAATPGETHWFGKDTPGKEGTPAHMVWSLHGKPLQNGLADIYPDIEKRMKNSAIARDMAGGSDDPGPAIEAEIRKNAGGQEAAAPTLPKVGDVVKGYRFMGGDPKNKSNWKRGS